MDQKDSLDDDSRWPARLLHVRTLTSYPREPGDIYGGQVKPSYNAISYTWGRFALKNQESPEVEAAPIKGTTWVDYLPRMDPARYTVPELVHAIKTAASPHDGYPAVDFVWLDIACINQTPNSLEMAREVGRQAKIFRGATDTFVWLTTLTSAGVLNWVWELDRRFLEQPRMGDMAAIESWLRDQLVALRWFIADEWFSSLWTLQEAFLSPRAIFMFKDGLSSEFLSSSLNGKGEIELFRLKSFVMMWQMYRWTCQDPGIRDCALAQELTNTISEIGIMDGVRDQWRGITVDDIEYPAGYMGNPLGLLVASKHRITTREPDRVYGIMQVFGLRLGQSAPGATGKHFSLGELQIQLASEILMQYPIFSQLIIQDEDCTVPKGWMINPSTTISEVGYAAWSHQSCGGKVMCAVTMSTEVDCDETWASFKGRAIRLEFFQETTSGGEKVFQDVVCTLDKLVRAEMIAKLGHTVETNKENMDGLLESYPGVRVLLLGFLTPPDGYEANPIDTLLTVELYTWGVGLLLAELYGRGSDGKHCHARLGVVTWSSGKFTMLDSAGQSQAFQDLLKGNGSDWIEIEGLFG